MVYRRSFSSKRTIYWVLMLVCILAFWVFENFFTPDTYSTTTGPSAGEALPATLVPTSTTGQIIVHNNFMLSYNEDYEQAEWVAYVLKKSHLTYDDRERPYFIEDPKVKTKSADWRNYKGSGYDRGHLCPAGDRRFSEQAYNETFYTSNIAPQNAQFNAGVWNRLELQIRQWAKRYGEVYVITAGILGPGLKKIGEEDVAVPKQFYKIVARGSQNNLKVAGFLMDAKESTRALSGFMVAVDEIEKRTGIDFFAELPNTLEERLEGKAEVSDWEF